MSLSFDCRRSEAKVKWLEKKIETEQDEYKLEKYKIDLDEARYGLANMQLVAKIDHERNKTLVCIKERI